MRSILDGYLTDECKNCPCWLDGSDGKGYGCGTSIPIDMCPAFKEMMERDERKRKENANETYNQP